MYQDKINYLESLYNKSPNHYLKLRIDQFKSLQDYDNQFLSSSEEEEVIEQTTHSELYYITQFVQSHDIKQLQVQLLTKYVDTLLNDTYYTADEILDGYNKFVKTNSIHKEDYIHKLLSIRDTRQLGRLLTKVNNIAKKYRSVTNVKAMFYYKI